MFIKKILNKKKRDNKIYFFKQKIITKNFDIKRFKTIFQKLKVKKIIYCMPDLNFKSKNFIPSGVSVPLKKSISPILLTPNNDSIGSLHFKLGRKLEKRELYEILRSLKKNIAIYRRNKPIISSNNAKVILKYGCKKIYRKWGFKHNDISSVYNKGSHKLNVSLKNLLKYFSNKKSKSMPKYIKEKNLLSAAKKNLGILDGSSHFIEFFKVKKIIKKDLCRNLNIDESSFFSLVHAGSGDVGRIIHHNILDLKKDSFIIQEGHANFYYEAYKAASNYAFSNRLYIYKIIKKSLIKFNKISFLKFSRICLMIIFINLRIPIFITRV